MNRKHTLTALTLVLATSAAFAQSSEIDLQHFGATQPSTTTRAAVHAEVLKARAAGESLAPNEADVAGVFQKVPVSTTTRAQVRAEVLKAQADGTLFRPSVYVGIEPTAVASTRTRDEVRKEAIAATRSRQAGGVQAGH